MPTTRRTGARWSIGLAGTPLRVEGLMRAGGRRPPAPEDVPWAHRETPDRRSGRWCASAKTLRSIGPGGQALEWRRATLAYHGGGPAGTMRAVRRAVLLAFLAIGGAACATGARWERPGAAEARRRGGQ